MFEREIETLLDAITKDYVEWSGRAGIPEEKAEEFRAGLEVEVGDGRRKYIKIIRNDSNHRCVWGFIAKKDNKGFRAGDIMLAASWNAPAMNKARGNLFTGYSIQWTGPRYL